MKIRALELKTWCESTLTPLAWQRVVLKALPLVEAHGFTIENMEEPKADIVLQGEPLQVILSVVEELYQVHVPESILVA